MKRPLGNTRWIRMLAVSLSSLAVTAVVPSAPAAAPAERRVTKTYAIDRGHIRYSSHEGPWVGTQPESFRAKQGERAVAVAVEDGTGRPVQGRLQNGSSVVYFCGETPQAIKIDPDKKLEVNVVFGTCDGELSVATQGTITITFSK